MFWEELTVTGWVFFIIACVGSVILVVQFILLIIGFAGGDADFDMGETDFDADTNAGADAGIFTLKGLVSFLAIGGWVGFAMEVSGVHIAATIPVAFICGAAAFVGIGFAMKAIYKMQSSGNINIDNSIGINAEVYLTIPANDKGLGKISVLVQDRLIELEARTTCDAAIPTGSIVKIVSRIGNTVFVEPAEISKEKENM